jgi:hypothetical protein
MTKKKIIILVIVLAIGSIILITVINAIRIYNDVRDGPSLNITKVQEYLNAGGSLDDPVTPELYEKLKQNRNQEVK